LSAFFFKRRTLAASGRDAVFWRILAEFAGFDEFIGRV